MRSLLLCKCHSNSFSNKLINVTDTWTVLTALFRCRSNSLRRRTRPKGQRTRKPRSQKMRSRTSLPSLWPLLSQRWSPCFIIAWIIKSLLYFNNTTTVLKLIFFVLLSYNFLFAYLTMLFIQLIMFFGIYFSVFFSYLLCLGKVGYAYLHCSCITTLCNNCCCCCCWSC